MAVLVELELNGLPRSFVQILLIVVYLVVVQLDSALDWTIQEIVGSSPIGCVPPL